MKWIKKYVLNKYIVSLLFFVVWITLIDQKDIFYVYGLKKRLHELQAKKQAYQKDIAQAKSELVNLDVNPKAKEKFAREYYLMKKDGETIFIVDDDTAIEKNKN